MPDSVKSRYVNQKIIELRTVDTIYYSFTERERLPLAVRNETKVDGRRQCLYVLEQPEQYLVTAPSAGQSEFRSSI